MEESTLIMRFIELAITAAAAVAASSGFWMFITKRTNENDLGRKLLIGLAHDRIVFLATRYLRRRCISHDEYMNLYEFLYKPYLELGGNGVTKHFMEEVAKLPIVEKKIPGLTKEIENDPTE